jgi:hypothetical protein
MKKYAALICALTFVAAVSCSKGPDAEVKILLGGMTKVTDAAAEKLEKAATAKEAGDALITYAESMKGFTQKGMDLQKKYPALNPRDDKKFKAESEALMKTMTRFSQAMTAVMTKFAGAKELTDAAMKMSEIMKDVK